jgi:osmoprotectant transport system permease protein
VSFIAFLASHQREFLGLLLQHVFLVGLSTLVAVAIGIPVGVLAARRPRAGAPIVWLANVVQTIPSLAMFGFLLPLPLIGGLGARVAVFVLILYALLPIIRTTVAGIRSVDPVVVEAAIALGMTPRQLLWGVQLPLALPSIVAGVRVAAVIGVGTATIAAAVGAGGLGEYIFRGLSMVDPAVILAGAVPAAALALSVDGGLLLAERAFSKRGRAGRFVPLAAAAAALLLIAAGAVANVGSRGDVVRVGSKNFTEQILLGEIVAQTLERDAHVRVERHLNLGGTFICDRALRSGDIDVYVEYTGTADTAVFKDPVETDPARVLARVRQRYAEVGLTLMKPLGFDNTFAILVRGGDADRYGLETIDDASAVSPRWRAGFGYEFLQRAACLEGILRGHLWIILHSCRRVQAARGTRRQLPPGLAATHRPRSSCGACRRSRCVRRARRAPCGRRGIAGAPTPWRLEPHRTAESSAGCHEASSGRMRRSGRWWRPRRSGQPDAPRAHDR